MHVPECLVTSFDIKIYNIGYESDLQDDHNEMHVNLKAKALFKS